MNNSDSFDLFGDIPSATQSDEPKVDYKIMPVSVIDIEAQKKRKGENHASTSSRANYSPFPEEVSDLCYQFFLRDSVKIVDPFAGWGERHSKAVEWGKEYTGFDISDQAIAKARDEFGVDNIKGDSRIVDIPAGFDGLITCPPYWNLEKYADNDGIDRIKKWADFLVDYENILTRFYNVAVDGATFCIMTGDWRKNHFYYDLTFQTALIFNKLGATVVDKITVSRKKVSKIKIMLPQAKRLGYTVRVHEDLQVFRK